MVLEQYLMFRDLVRGLVGRTARALASAPARGRCCAHSALRLRVAVRARARYPVPGAPEALQRRLPHRRRTR